MTFSMVIEMCLQSQFFVSANVSDLSADVFFHNRLLSIFTHKRSQRVYRLHFVLISYILNIC